MPYCKVFTFETYMYETVHCVHLLFNELNPEGFLSRRIQNENVTVTFYCLCSGFFYLDKSLPGGNILLNELYHNLFSYMQGSTHCFQVRK
jgi:hypothetical protein